MVAPIGTVVLLDLPRTDLAGAGTAR